MVEVATVGFEVADWGGCYCVRLWCGCVFWREAVSSLIGRLLCISLVAVPEGEDLSEDAMSL
jgi:hypothetical protein